ncbi:MAG: HYR domain-containing protein, partial [Bacteroidales bacterium]|nr:HYR domain-containing protein [Bacteroidales bacterium]
MRKFYLLFFFLTLFVFGAVAQAQKASDLGPEGKSILKSANTVTQIMPELTGTSDCTIDALLLTADVIEYVEDVQAYLMNTGMFNVVDIINDSIPTLPTLRNYDAILVWADANIDDTIGDTLAAYIDEGGGVVSAVYNLYTGWGIEGTRFNTDYLLLNLGTYSPAVTTTLGTVHDPNHPIMDLVSNLSNSTSYRNNNETMTTGSVVIAEWSDGLPLVVVKENLGPANARRADINLFPPSSTVRSDLWDATTDGDILLANALVWVSKKCDSECHDDIIVDNDPGTCGAVVNYHVPSPPDADVTRIDESGLTSGDEFPVGTTLQEWEFDYGDGIKDTCSFTVTVVDNEAPVVDCPDDMVVSNDPGECHAVVNFSNFNLMTEGEAAPGITLPNAPTNQAGVAYNPDKKLYYAVRAGNPTYTLYTYDESGNQVAESTAGFDFRGLWWNPNTSSLEGNGYIGNGYRKVDLDANGYALSTGTTDPASNYQPNSQSQGDYDYDLDEVIYCYNNTIYRTSRATGASIADIAITGLPANTINTTFVGYTGVPGGEVLIYDYSNKAVYFINKTTGEYSWSVQLPSSAPAKSYLNTSYANGHIWITDGTMWYSYKVVENISDNCDTSLIVEQTAGLPSGSEFPVGVTTNTFTVTDSNDNTTECTFNVTVEDNEAPTVVC